MGRIRKIGLPICNYSQILYQFLTFTQNLKRSLFWTSGVHFIFVINYTSRTSTISRIPTFRTSSKAVFSQTQHTVPCRSRLLLFSRLSIHSSFAYSPYAVGLLIVTSCIPLYPTALFNSLFNSTRCLPCVVFRAKQLQRDHSQTANKNTLPRWLYYILVNIGR